MQRILSKVKTARPRTVGRALTGTSDETAARASTLGRAVGAASALRLADRYLEGRAERGPQSGQTERARRPWRESRISVP